MKKAFKIIGFIVIGLFAIIAAGAAWVSTSGLPTYENQAPTDFKVIADSANIAEGARMAGMMCAMCHKSEDGKLGGAYMWDAKDFGEIYSANITQHPEYGITHYTNGELAYLFRTGIKKDGQYAPPYMPKFPHLSDEDLNNIIAFLRSDHPLVQPSENNHPANQPSFLTKALCKVAFSPLPYPEKPIPNPDPNDKVALGKYIATAKFDCYSCHSADFKTADIMNPENSGGYFGGGNKLLREDESIVLSPNLTMDKETGLGNWTEEEFIRTIKYGIRPNDRPATAYPMIPFTEMTDEEASAVWAYLQTLPVIRNEQLRNKEG